MAGHFRLTNAAPLRTLRMWRVRGKVHVLPTSRGAHARRTGTPIWQTITAIVAGIGLGVLVAVASAQYIAAAANQAPAYTRNVGVILSTRTKGEWIFHCHNYVAQNVNGNGKGSEGVFIAAGCLPPKRLH